jgi:hypothetical protein
MIDLSGLIEPIARELLGEPNKKLSTKTELRYGSRGSLAVDIKKGIWHDHELGQGGGVLDLITRETGLQGDDRMQWLEQHGYAQPNGRDQGKSSGTIVATYDYPDENRNLLFQVVRFEPKDFRQRRPGENGEWTWSVKGVRQVPYRLPDLLEHIDRVIFIPEGEKDVDRLWDIGVPATCNAGGAGKWKPALTKFFHGADVVVIADNDPQKRHPKTNEPMFHPDGRPMLPGQDHARQVCRELAPVAQRVRYLDLTKMWPECPPKGDISDLIAALGVTADELYEYVEDIPDFVDAPVTTNGGGEQQTYTNGGKQAPQQKPIRASPYVLPDPESIPVRAWLSAMHYMRGAVTSTVAPGGFGKTSLALFEALRMAGEGKRVWYISGEDDKVELDRRIAAHAKINPEMMPSLANGGRLFLDDKISFPFKIARAGRNGPQFDEQLLKNFEEAIAEDHIDVVILDPLISFHYLQENDTASMDAFVKRLGEICSRQHCGIELAHHVRKPGTGQSEITVYDARGAGAIVNAVRSCRVLNQMSEIEAEQAEVPVDKRMAYIRIDNGKRNMAPPEKASWCKLVSVEIANGDNVQAIERWDFPKVFGKLTTADIDWVKGLLRVKPYRADSRSPDWLGHELCRRFNRDSSGLNKGDIKWANAVLTTWFNNRIFTKKVLKDEASRDRTFYVLMDVEAAREAPTASVAFLITHKMKAELRERGFTDEQIKHLTPEEANDILRP